MTALLCGGIALLAGVKLARRLETRSYRQPEDHPRSGRSPLVWLPAVAAVTAALLAWNLAGWPLVITLTLLLAVVWMLGLAVIDVDVRRLPDTWTLAAIPVAAAVLAGWSWLVQEPERWFEAVVCAFGSGFAYLLLALISPEGLGMGDVKLSVTLGMILGWFGWEFALVGFLLAFLVGTAAGLALAVRARTGRRTSFPFGPAMIVGAVLTLLLPGVSL